MFLSTVALSRLSSLLPDMASAEESRTLPAKVTNEEEVDASTSDNCGKAEQGTDIEQTLNDQLEHASELLEPTENGVNGSEIEPLPERSVKLNKFTSEMANIGRRLQSQLTSLHETVCIETEASKEHSKNWDPFTPELIARLHDSTSDVNCEVKVLERYLDQVRELITLGRKSENGFNEMSCEENNNQPDDQKLSLKEKIQNDEEKKKWAKEMEFLRNQLQSNGGILDHEGLIRRLENDRSKLELENLKFKKLLKLIKDKLSDRGQMDEELDSLTSVECRPGDTEEDGFALSEVVTLRKERKVLLATVHRLQNQSNGGSKKSSTDTNSDLDMCDVAIQCKMNILGQMANQGVTLSNELEELKKSLNDLQTEYFELEEESKSMEEENSKLTEEKRALEDSVNKLRSQITDALDSSLDEMDHLHREKEEIESKCKVLIEENKKLRNSFVELSKKNAAYLESVLDEIERKDSLEDAVDYLGTEVQRFNEINSQAVHSSTTEACLPGDTAEKIHNSNILTEIKTCKELIDSQRNQIRQLQVDKRDIEDRYINVKREVVILKTKRGDSDNMEPSRKSSVERCEFLKQDILRLTKRGTELENVIRTLKSDNSNLEEEKVCLLDSLYHQLEKNEKLELQIDRLKSTINEYNTAKGLDSTTTKLSSHDKRDDSNNQERDLNGNLMNGNTVTSGCVEDSEDGSSLDDLKTKSLQLKDELKTLQERVLELEEENKRIQQDLEESRKNEKEFRDLVSTLKKEATVNRHQLRKNQEVTDTLQGCLREAHEEKEELVESLEEVTEEKTALEKKVQTLESELNQLKENYKSAKSELETAVSGVDDIDKAKQQMGSLYAKLSDLYEVLTDKDKDSCCEDLDTELKQSTSLEEQGGNILSILEKVQQEVFLLKKEVKRVKGDHENLKVKMDTSQTEKLSLQRYVRELDEKKRQMKSFITKLTEEKEAMSEQMDEIKQQKNNLADALENVYQSKEGLQCQLEDALSKQHESSKSLSEVSAEVQSLKKSLSRMVEERDALKEALLETTTELQMLKTSEAKWKEKVTGAQVEADQSVEDTSEASKEDEKDVILRLHVENDELKKQIEELKLSQRSSHGDTPKEKEAPIASIEDLELDETEKTSEVAIEVEVASEYGSSPLVYEMVTNFDKTAFEEPSGEEKDLFGPTETSPLLESVPPGDQQEAAQHFQAALDEKRKQIEQLQQDLQKRVEENKALTEALQLSNMQRDTLQDEAKESREKVEALEKSYETLKATNEETNKWSAKRTEEVKNLEQKYTELSAEKERTEWESDTRTKEVARLLEQMELLEEQLQKKSYALTHLEDKLKGVEKGNEDLNALVASMKSEKEALQIKQEQIMNEYKALEESLARTETEKGKEGEGILRLKKELENTTKSLNDEIENLKSSLKEVQTKLVNTEDDLELAKEEKGNLSAQVSELKEKGSGLREELEAKSQENEKLQESLETLQGDKEFLARNLEETKMESNSMRDQLQGFKNQASDIRAFVEEQIKNNSEKQSEEAPQGETNLLQDVCEFVEALLEEKASLEARLTKAETSKREIQDDKKQLLQERTELTIQLQEALDKESAEESPSQSKQGYDEVRLSREISDVRSLIEKLSLQKEKLGAALAHKEHQIAAVTAEATEKTKMLENKEKEAESLSLTKAEVAVALEKAKNGSEKLLEELQREKDNVVTLTQELEHLKEQKNVDLQVCVNRLEEEKKAFMMAVNKSRELEKRLKIAEEENIKIRDQKNELESNIEAQAASIVSFETIGIENEVKWKKDVEEKDEQLNYLKQEIKNSNIALTDLLKVVDELKSKIVELENHCSEAEESRKEAVEEINNLQTKLNEEMERKKALEAKMEEMKGTIVEHEKEKDDLKKHIADDDIEKQLLQKNLKEFEGKNKDKAKKLLDLNCTKTFLEDECKKSNWEITSLKEELAKKTSSLENIERELYDSKEVIQECKSKYAELKKEKEELQRSLGAAESKLQKAEATITNTKEQNEKLTKKLEAIEKEMASLNSAFVEAQNKEQTLQVGMKTETERIENELQSLKNQCATLQKQLDEANEKKGELEKDLEQRKTLEKDLAKLTDEHKALKIFSQKLVDDKVDKEEIRKEKRALEKQLRREMNERATVEEEMGRLRVQYGTLKEKIAGGDHTDAGDFPQSEGEQITASTEGGLLSTGVEIEFGLESAPDDESAVEDLLAKEREMNADLREEIEELTDEKDELNEIIGELRSKTKKLQTNVDVLIEEKESLEDKLDESSKNFKEEIGSLVDGNKELSRKLEVLLKDKNLLHEEIKTKEKEYSEVLEEGKKLEDALEKSRQELARLTSELDLEVKKRFEGELIGTKERVKELESKLEKMSLEKQEIMSELAERKNENSTLRLAVEEMTVAKEDAEWKSGVAQKDLYDELDHVQKELDEKSAMIISLEEEIAKYKTAQFERGTHEEVPKTGLEELEQLRRQVKEKDQTIESLEDEFASHKRLTYEREQEIHVHLDRIQAKLSEKGKKITSLEEEIAEYKRTGQLQKQGIDEIPAERTDKDYQDQLVKLKNEIAEKDQRIGSLEEAIVDYKRTRFDQERDFQSKEAHLAAAREELYKTMKERCEEEERMESLRRANNRLQEALDLTKEKESKLRKELQAAQGRQRSQNLLIEERIRRASAGNVLECERVEIKPSKVSELKLGSSEIEPSNLERTVKSIQLDNARKEIQTLEARGQELRSELRKARDLVFDLQLELSDAFRALRQKERLHEQERKLFQSTIEDMEKEYNKMRKEFSSLISMEKNRSSFITVVELKGSLKKAESDMLDAIAKTSQLLSKAKNNIEESRRSGSDEEIAKRSKDRTRSFIEKSTQENKDLLKQLDDAWKERDRLAKRLKRSEGTQALLKQILNESLVEVERFKRLVDECGRSEKRRTTSVVSQKPAVSTQELETQSDLTLTDLEEAEMLKDRLEELRSNIRGLEECLEEERSKGEGHLLDYLREKNRLNAEITALKQCVQDATRKNEALQSAVSDLQEKLEHAQREKTGVQFEVDKLRKLSYDERAEKNSLIQANSELKRSLMGKKEKEGKVVKESDRLKELKKEKERWTAENETLRKNVRDNKENFATVCKELENTKYRLSEVSNTKEIAMQKNMALEAELKATKDNLAALERDHDQLKTIYRNSEENCKQLDNERAQLIEDAHSFKMKMEKNNQDLISKFEAKEHEAISLQAKVEEFTALQRKLENACRGLEKDKERVVSHARLLESDKQRIEAINKEQKAEIERLLHDRESHKELNEKLQSLFAEKDKLEEMNKNLEVDLRELYNALDAKSQEVNNIVQELHDMASKVKQLEKEKQRESSLKEQLAEQVIEKDNAMKVKTKLLSDRLDGLVRETENLKDSSEKMEQMGVEYRRLEEENLQLIETTQKLREEIVSLKKENDLVRRACQQLRGRKTKVDEKDAGRRELDGEALPRKKTSVQRLEPVVERVAEKKTSELNAAPEIRRKSRDSVPGDIKLSKGLQSPMPPYTGEGRGRQLERGSQKKQQRSHSSPAVKRYPGSPEMKQKSAPGSSGRSPPSTDSSRSSETDRSMCSRSSYCSPILSLVDTCPLHQNASVERPPPPPVPNQCPICKKERRGPGMAPKSQTGELEAKILQTVPGTIKYLDRFGQSFLLALPLFVSALVLSVFRATKKARLAEPLEERKSIGKSLQFYDSLF